MRNFKILFFTGFFFLPILSFAQAWSEVIKLTASDAAMSDLFSHAIDIEGDRAIISSYENDDAGLNSGSAYIFELDGGTWVETQKLTASDASAGDDFGYSVALFGDRVIIGARGNNDGGSNSGSAYIFDLVGDTWVETQKLTASDAAVEDRFGNAVSLSNDRAIIGAYLNDDDGTNSGAAYIFELDDGTWVETQKLTASDGSAGDQFGFSVSLMVDRACIGAYRNDDGGEEIGAAYIFDLEGDIWEETQKLTASDGVENDYFAFSISLDVDRVLIGAYGNDEAAAFGGSAYIFDLEDGTWVESQKLTAADSEASDYFGYSVSLSGNQLIVGAWGGDDDGSSSGSAYIFNLEVDTWEEVQKITTSDAATNDAVGKPVSISSYTAIVGATGNSDAGSFSGSAYVFGTCFTLPVITASADLVEVCEGELVTLTGGGGEGSYSWDNGATNGVPFTPELGTTTYTVTGENLEGCENTASIEIVVNPLPEVVAMADDAEVCLGDLVTLTGEGATSYSWEGGVMDGVPFTPELGEYLYTVIGTDDNGCSDTASLEIVVYDLPDVIAAASDSALCYGEALALTGEGATDYEWDYDVIDGEEFIPEIGEYLYTVIGTDDNGCSDTASLEVTVYETLTITAITADETLGGDGSIDVTVTGGNPAYTFDWDNDGTGDFDDTEDLTGLSGGDYTVVINCSAGCNATQTITVNSQLGIHGDQGGNLAIYPNPTSNLVTITLEGLFVYSLVGVNGAVLVTKKSINQAQLDLSEFADGIYFLEIQSENGSETVKLLKQ